MSKYPAASWFNPCSSSSDEEENRYRTTHQSRTKQLEFEQWPATQDYWSWEEILDGKGPWAQPGEYRRPKAELEAAKAERRRYEEAARRRGWKPENQAQDRSYEGFMVNDELLQRLANGRAGSIRPLVIPRTTDTSAPLDYHSPPAEVEGWLRGKGFTEPTVTLLGRLTGAELFALSKEDLRMFSPEEGARVYSQMMVQKALLEDVRKSTELETMMEKQKQKADFQLESRRL